MPWIRARTGVLAHRCREEFDALGGDAVAGEAEVGQGVAVITSILSEKIDQATECETLLLNLLVLEAVSELPGAAVFNGIHPQLEPLEALVDTERLGDRLPAFGADVVVPQVELRTHANNREKEGWRVEGGFPEMRAPLSARR